MRAGDLALPALVPHPIPPDAPIAGWPVELRIGIERDDGQPWTWDQPGLVWDDTSDPAAVWDGVATAPVWVDAVCDFQALVIDDGAPDELGIYPARQLTLSLDNRTGAWSTWSPTGRAAAFPVGTPVAVWATLAGDDRWLFSGHVAAWSQIADRVEISAFDATSDLALDWGAEWTPGAPAQRPGPRISAIAAQAGWPGTVAGDVGHTDLLTSLVDADVSPLEAMQRAALSDGGIVAVDVDGRLLYRDRYWRDGRADQQRVWSFTDNACDTLALVVWDPDTGANDTAVATQVRLTNTADVTVTAAIVARRPLTLTHPDPDWWPDATVGATLAAWLLEHAALAGFRVNEFALHLADPYQPDLWDAGTATRRGDRLSWVTDTFDAAGGALRLDVDVICAGVRHDITPDDWQTTILGTRAVAARTALLWDQSPYAWDDPNPDNVWRA